MHTTLLEIDQTEKELQAGKANWKGDVDGIREVVVEWKMEVEKMGRDYQRIVVEKELEVEELRKKLESKPGDPPAAPMSEADRLNRALGDDSSILYAVEQLKLENSVLEDTVSAWEGKMKSLLRCKTDDAVEKRKMQMKIEEMEREMERRSEAERRGREASDSPRKGSIGTLASMAKVSAKDKDKGKGDKDKDAANDETVDNLVQEYTQLVYTSQVKEDELNKSIGDLNRTVEELMVKNQAQEANILMLMQKGQEGGAEGKEKEEGAKVKDLRKRVERAEKDLKKAREGKENVRVGTAEDEGLRAELVAIKDKLSTAKEELEKARSLHPPPPSAPVKDEGMEKEMLELRKEVESLKLGKAEAEGERGKLQMEQEATKTEVDVLSKKCLALAAEKEGVEGVVEAMKTEIGTLKEKCTALASEKESFEGVKGVEGGEGTMKAEIDTLKEKCAALASEKEHLVKEVDAMSSGGDESAKKFEAIIAELEKEKGALREEKARELEEVKVTMGDEKEKAVAEARAASEGEKGNELEELRSALEGERTKAVEEITVAMEGEKANAVEVLIAAKEGEKAKALEELAKEKEGEKAKALEELTTEKEGEKTKALEELTAKKESEMQDAVKQEQDLHAKTKDDYEKKIAWFQDKTTALVGKHKEEVGKLNEELSSIQERCDERQRKALAEAEEMAEKDKEDAVEAMRQSQLDQIAAANSERAECKELYMKEAARRKAVHNKLIELQGNIRVIARVRPVVDAERSSCNEGNKEVVECTTAEDLVVHRDITTRTRFEFDRVCDQDSTQSEAYGLVSPLVTSVLDGYNVCIFAYGQTGSGKTYTMEGPADNRGVNYKAIEEMFKVAGEREEDVEYNFRVSMLEIYNETVRDLLNPAVDEFKQPKVLEIRTTAEGTVAQGLTEVIVQKSDKVYEAMGKGSSNRAVGSHSMNLHSSRSHLIVSVKVKGVDKHNGVKCSGKLHLIDLAGSERISKTDATGDRLKEAKNINNSLSALGNVINALGSKKPGHIPYRNSKLTFLLTDSLGGNSKVMMFVNLSPVMYNMGESLCSLTFASRCRAVNLGNSKKNDDSEKREIKRLKNLLRTNGIKSS